MNSRPAGGAGEPSVPGDLSPDVRARSILRGTHQLLVTELGTATPIGPVPPRPSSTPVLFGFVEVDAVPYLVSFGPDALPAGRVLAVAEGLGDRLGELHVLGEVGEWVYPSSRPRVAEVLEEHRECMDATARDLMEVVRLRVAPVRILSVWTSSPGASAPEPVDRGRFETAEADLWVAYGPDAIRHLQECHHDLLLSLVREQGATGCTAVSVSALDRGGAILTALGHDGVMDIVIPFAPPGPPPGAGGRGLAGC